MITATDIKELAGQVGFDLCGVATADSIPEADRRYHEWLRLNHHAGMDWMAKYSDRRAHASRLADGVRSVIVIGLNYYHPNSEPVPPGHGRVSRYARGRDYHKIIHPMTVELIARIQRSIDKEVTIQHRPTFKHWVDYGPMLERAYAVRAGLGFVGKNTNLITRNYGSWVFLGEIVTTLELENDVGDPGGCGRCRECIDACPTGAITDEGMLDSRKCLSYLTVEHRGDIAAEAARSVGQQIFGCDICQEVCPFNLKRQKPADHPLLQYDHGAGEFVDCEMILNTKTGDDFLAFAAGTPLTRVKLAGLQRNARIVLRNSSPA